MRDEKILGRSQIVEEVKLLKRYRLLRKQDGALEEVLTIEETRWCT